MIGSQSGSVMSATSTSPGRNSCMRSIESSTRTGPAPIRAPIARPSTRTGPREERWYFSTVLPVLDCTVSGRAWRMYSRPSAPSSPHSMSIARP